MTSHAAVSAAVLVVRSDRRPVTRENRLALLAIVRFCSAVFALWVDAFAGGGLCSAGAATVASLVPESLQAEDEAKLDRILRTVGERVEPASTAGATAPGDGRKMRGIPIVGRSTAGGAIPGSDPVRAVLAKER